MDYNNMKRTGERRNWYEFSELISFPLNDRFLRNFFMAGLFYSQSFCQKFAERKSPKKYFFFILRFGVGPGIQIRATFFLIYIYTYIYIYIHSQKYHTIKWKSHTTSQYCLLQKAINAMLIWRGIALWHYLKIATNLPNSQKIVCRITTTITKVIKRTYGILSPSKLLIQWSGRRMESGTVQSCLHSVDSV